MKNTVLLAVLVAAVVLVATPSESQWISVPGITKQKEVPVLGNVNWVLGVQIETSGTAPLTRNQRELSSKLGSWESRALWKMIHIGHTCIASHSSMANVNPELAPNECFRYPLAVHLNTPNKIVEMAISFDSGEDVWPLHPLPDFGWATELPIKELPAGFYYQLKLCVKLEGREKWELLGIIPIGSKKTTEAFSNAHFFRVTQPLEELENVPIQELGAYFHFFMNGWVTTFKSPVRSTMEALKQGQIPMQAGGIGAISGGVRREMEDGTPVPEDINIDVQPEPERVKVEEEPDPTPTNPPPTPPVVKPEPEEVQRPVEARTPDFRVEGFDSSVPIELICGGKRVSPQELTATVAIQKLPAGAGWYQLHIGFSGNAQMWEVSDDSPNKSRFYYDGRHPVVVKVQPKRRG